MTQNPSKPTWHHLIGFHDDDLYNMTKNFFVFASKQSFPSSVTHTHSFTFQQNTQITVDCSLSSHSLFLSLGFRRGDY
ncbi:hypothetical protein QVD17_14837 [Tagetes erecta]|uniref:Uncharacterized protein n=1 Tax=Tagetes erecta TaxID=13708 RepID=A0AAD8NY64_TARER|nr:hypothetical protein QVD17_14837 [Tagetes erecta]